MTSLYTQCVSRLLFPLHERLKGHDTVAVRRGLEDTQWWPRERLRALQIRRLKAFLTDVGQHVPYYHELFAKHRFGPDCVTELDDLQKLPLLEKADIRAHSEDLKHPRGRGLSRFNTGGSSGEPLVFFIGNERVSHDVAAKWRATRWWGVDVGDPEVVIWGSPIELSAQDRIRALRDRVLRTELLPAFEMSEAKLDGFVAAIRARQPKMLFGYPSALSHIARHADSRGQRMDDLGIQVAFVTSERLYDDQRASIERVFGCRVANGYGGRDAGFIAHECPHGGMHLTAEDIIVELTDGEGRWVPEGEPGEIVITHLATRDFPFIRYRTGDVAVMSTSACACGRGLPMLQEIQGRSTDFVVAADGTVMHGLALIYAVRDRPGIRQFKIVQESRRLTRVLIAAEPPFDPDLEVPSIRAAMLARLGAEVEIDISLVEQVESERSGKFRYVVSKVDVQSGTRPMPIGARINT